MKTKNLAVLSIFTALTVICAQISIALPFSPVPFSLSVVAVFLCGALLSAKHAAVAQIVYILLGAAGLPVFGHFAGGLSAIAGPTGGYILAYPLMAALIALIAKGLHKEGVAAYALGMTASLAVCYLFGSVWLALSAGMTFAQAVAAGVVPFILFDVIKIAVCSSFLPPLQRSITKSGVYTRL